MVRKATDANCKGERMILLGFLGKGPPGLLFVPNKVLPRGPFVPVAAT